MLLRYNFFEVYLSNDYDYKGEGDMKIGFIGIGVMGRSIVKHLLNGGHEVTIHTRTKEKAQEIISLGAIWSDSIAQLSKNKEIIFTMVGMPQDVREVYFGQNGIIENADKGTILIDLTTSQPSLAIEIAMAAANRKLHSLDAPVSGGDIGAQNGTLSLMIGGEKQIVDKVEAILQLFSALIVHQGEAGSGQHTKMCNQILGVNNLIGVCESIAYAIAAGLEVEKVLKSIASGAAGSWSMTNLGPKILAGDFKPGFFVKHMLKDLQIAVVECKRMNIQLPGLQLAHDLFKQLAAKGLGEEGTQVLAKHYLQSIKGE